jgi:mannose-1-phosphate guanylyltransferase
MAIKRLDGIFPPERIMVVTGKDLASKLQAQYPGIPQKNYLIEPYGRGTAAAVGLAAIAIHSRDESPDVCMAVLTADHYIMNVPYFRNLLLAGYDVAQNGYLVTIGIHPTHPTTGFGYIQRGDWIGGYQGHPVYHVNKFIEKPDISRAKMMVNEGNFVWNSGMFIWKNNRIIGEIQDLMPHLWKGLNEIQQAWHGQERSQVMDSVWDGLNPQTIDYGIMEKASKTAVLPAESLGWSDVGNWESLFEILPSDENGNVVINTQHVGVDTNKSIIFGNKPDRLIATIGAKNLIIVDTGDALLICPREETQNVRRVIETLRELGKEEYL